MLDDPQTESEQITAYEDYDPEFGFMYDPDQVTTRCGGCGSRREGRLSSPCSKCGGVQIEHVERLVPDPAENDTLTDIVKYCEEGGRGCRLIAIHANEAGLELRGRAWTADDVREIQKRVRRGALTRVT